jgi:phosphatidate cytidylyltransferase
MLVKRTISAVVIIIVSLVLVLAGGWIYTIGLALILSIAIWEYAHIFEKGGYAPAKVILTLGTFLALLCVKSESEILGQAAFSLAILTILVFHVITYTSHQKTAALDLAISLAGLVFITGTGAYLIKLRFLPEGLFWLIQCVVPAGISDIGAFFLGSMIGKHKIAPELSPNKTVEGYIGGIITSLAVGYGLGYLFSSYSATFTGTRGLWIGLIVGIISPLGDFTKSIFKRQFGLKNTGTLIPGHGGVLDRIDTWLIAGIVGYFMIQFLYL